MKPRGIPDAQNDQRWCAQHDMHATDCFELHYPICHDGEALREAVQLRAGTATEPPVAPPEGVVGQVFVRQHPRTGLWRIFCSLCGGSVGGNYPNEALAEIMAAGHRKPHPARA